MGRNFLRTRQLANPNSEVPARNRRSVRRRLIALGSIFTLVVPIAMVSMATPTGAGAAYCTDSSSACVISAATTYLDALVSHNASGVRLAPDAIRTENGFDTGDGGAAIANDLATNPQYLVVGGIRDVRWFVDGDEAIAFYLLYATVPVLGTQFGTTHLAERFQVENGLITQIEAIDCTHPGLVPDTERTSTLTPLVSEQCIGQ
jgi:hypothetical protein